MTLDQFREATKDIPGDAEMVVYEDYFGEGVAVRSVTARDAEAWFDEIPHRRTRRFCVVVSTYD